MACAAADVAAQPFSFRSLHPIGQIRSALFAISPIQQGGFVRFAGPDVPVPGLWAGTAGGFTPLVTAGTISGEVRAIDGDTQAGYNGIFPYLWRGTPESAVNLSPAGARGGAALGAAGGTQVGSAYFGDEQNAGYWRGIAESWVNLHPSGAVRSEAWATDGARQSGFVVYNLPEQGFREHAALWSGSAASFVDLHPTGRQYSMIRGMAGQQQVGHVDDRPALWTGTPGSFVDLTPSGFLGGELRATTGAVQVGTVGRADGWHPGVWFGTPESFISLRPFLPPGYGNAWAYCIAQSGDQLFIGGEAVGPGGIYEAVMWTGTIPAPSAAAVVLLGVLPLARRRR